MWTLDRTVKSASASQSRFQFSQQPPNFFFFLNLVCNIRNFACDALKEQLLMIGKQEL